MPSETHFESTDFTIFNRLEALSIKSDAVDMSSKEARNVATYSGRVWQRVGKALLEFNWEIPNDFSEDLKNSTRCLYRMDESSRFNSNTLSRESKDIRAGRFDVTRSRLSDEKQGAERMLEDFSTLIQISRELMIDGVVEDAERLINSLELQLNSNNSY